MSQVALLYGDPDLAVYGEEGNYRVIELPDVERRFIDQLYLDFFSSENRKPLVDMADAAELLEGNTVRVEQQEGDLESYLERNGEEVPLQAGTAAALASAGNEAVNDFDGKNMDRIAGDMDVDKDFIADRIIDFDHKQKRPAKVPGETVAYLLNGVEQKENHNGYRESVIFEDAADDMAETRIELPAVGLSVLGRFNLRRKAKKDLEQAKYNPLAASKPADYIAEEPVTPEELDRPHDIVSLLVQNMPEDLDIYAYEEGDGVNLSTEIDGDPIDFPPETVIASLNDLEQIYMEKKTREKMIARDLDTIGLSKNFNSDRKTKNPDIDPTFQ